MEQRKTHPFTGVVIYRSAPGQYIVSSLPSAHAYLFPTNVILYHVTMDIDEWLRMPVLHIRIVHACPRGAALVLFRRHYYSYLSRHARLAAIAMDSTLDLEWAKCEDGSVRPTSCASGYGWMRERKQKMSGRWSCVGTCVVDPGLSPARGAHGATGVPPRGHRDQHLTAYHCNAAVILSGGFPRAWASVPLCMLYGTNHASSFISRTATIPNMHSGQLLKPALVF